MNRLAPFLGIVVCAACGDRSPRPPSTTPAADATARPVADATAPAESPADPSPAAVSPSRACPPAHAATLGECSDGTRCVLLLEISATCVVKVANELHLPDVALPSDGGGLGDLAWPTRAGALVLVNMVDTWSWAALPAPLAAPRDALAKVTWTPATVGATEPEGYQYGVVSDGAKALLVGCKAWRDDCGPDADECEEWHCTQHVFVDPRTGKRLAKAPTWPFVGGAKTGAITDAVTLGEKGKERTCAVGSAAPDTWYGDALDGSIALSSTDWLALRYQRGSRAAARWRLDAEYMRGCDDLYDAVEGEIVVGPDRLWARSTRAGWEVHHGPFGQALTDATGKIKVFGDSIFVFAAD